MKRIVLWTIAVLFAVNLGLLLSGYGIRLNEHPCTHFVGFVIIANLTNPATCPKFGRWELAVP